MNISVKKRYLKCVSVLSHRCLSRVVAHFGPVDRCPSLPPLQPEFPVELSFEFTSFKTPDHQRRSNRLFGGLADQDAENVLTQKEDKTHLHRHLRVL